MKILQLQSCACKRTRAQLFDPHTHTHTAAIIRFQYRHLCGRSGVLRMKYIYTTFCVHSRSIIRLLSRAHARVTRYKCTAFPVFINKFVRMCNRTTTMTAATRQRCVYRLVRHTPSRIRLLSLCICCFRSQFSMNPSNPRTRTHRNASNLPRVAPLALLFTVLHGNTTFRRPTFRPLCHPFVRAHAEHHIHIQHVVCVCV